MRVAAFFAAGALAFTMTAGAAPSPNHRFKTEGAPAFPVAYGGFLWVAAHRSGAIYEIDPRRNRIVHSYQTDESACYLNGSGDLMVFYTCDGPGGKYVDMRTGRMHTFGGGPGFATPISEGQTQWGNIDYAGSEWTKGPDSNEVLRLDPRTHVVLKRFHGIEWEGNPWTVADGSLWMPAFTTVTRFDATNDTATIIPLPGSLKDPGPNQGYADIERLAITPGALWATNPAGLYRIDARTNEATLIPGIRVGDLDEFGYIDLVSANGSLFMRNGPNQVIRIDPTTGKIMARYPATGGGGGIEVAYGSLWVTNFISDTTWRIPLG